MKILGPFAIFAAFLAASLAGFIMPSAGKADASTGILKAWPDLVGPVDYSASTERLTFDLASLHLFGDGLPTAPKGAGDAGENNASDFMSEGVKLVGIASHDSTPTAMLDLAQEGAMTVTVGSVLASGWTVREITLNAVVFGRDQEIQMIELHDGSDGNQ